MVAGESYPAELVSLDLVLLLITATQATVVDELWKFLVDELVDFGHRLLQPFLVPTSHVEVEGGVLTLVSPVSGTARQAPLGIVALTEAVARLLLG